MDEKSRLYLTQDQEKSRQKYSLPVGYGDPKTGELKGIFLSNATTLSLRSTKFFNLFDLLVRGDMLYLRDGRLYTKQRFTRLHTTGKLHPYRSPVFLQRIGKLVWDGGSIEKPDLILSVPIGIDTKNPKVAYCSEDRIVIGSHWVEKQSIYGAYVLAHELAHFILGDVHVTLNNIKAKQEREAIKNAIAGALVGAATGAVSGAVSDNQSVGQSATAGAIHGATWGAAYGSAVGAYLGRYMYSHEMEYNTKLKLICPHVSSACNHQPKPVKRANRSGALRKACNTSLNAVSNAALVSKTRLDKAPRKTSNQRSTG